MPKEPACAAPVEATGELALPVREGPAQPTPPHKGYSARKARGGEIILRTRARRIIFVSGLIGAVVLALVLVLIGFSRA